MCKTALKPIFFSINKISLDLSIPIVLQTTYTNEDLEIYPVNPVSLVLQILCPTQYVNSYLIVIPGGSAGKESACNAGDPGSIPESGRSPREGNSHPLHCSCLEISEKPDGLQSMRWQRVGQDGSLLLSMCAYGVTSVMSNSL